MLQVKVKVSGVVKCGAESACRKSCEERFLNFLQIFLFESKILQFTILNIYQLAKY